MAFGACSMIPLLLDLNRPFHSCLLGDLAFVWQRGWRWPCFDTDVSAFVMYMRLVSVRTTWFTQQKQRGLYQNKVTSSLTAIQRPGHRAGNCKMVYLYAPSCCNLTSSCRYIGPCPLIALKVIMTNLNCILNWTGNQWSSRRTGVIWHIFGILKIILAAEFWRRWSLVNSLVGKPYKILLQ